MANEARDTLKTSAKEDRKFNRRNKIATIAREILINGDSLMTQAEAFAKAEAFLLNESN